MGEDNAPKAMVYLGNSDPVTRRAEIGVIALDKRQGHATAAMFALVALAFRSMGLNSLFCVVNADNAPCLQMITKIGQMTYEGRRRASRLKDGKFIDQHVFSILASEPEKWSAPYRGGA